MPEKAMKRIVTISDRYPSVEINMKLFAAFLPQQHYTIAVKAAPSLIPEDLNDPLFFNGISVGIHDAIHKNDRYYLIAAAEVDITDLSFSQPPHSFDPREIAKLSAELRGMTFEAFRSILSSIE